ncbi:response regulator [candidate division KSB1 bacterium]|nr:response regulator [candidate division KSB1 bacterium]
MKKPLKVLIVEDERLTAKSLQLDLEDLGAEVLELVARGEDAVVVALREHPDLILMDIRLAGGLDGVEAAEEILKKEKIPIIFMTGYAMEYVKERAEKLNPVEYFEKPINLNKIKQIMDTLKINNS